MIEQVKYDKGYDSQERSRSAGEAGRRKQKPACSCLQVISNGIIHGLESFFYK